LLLVTNPINIPIQLISSQEEVFAPVKYVKILLNFNLFSRGLLLEVDINNVNRITLELEKYVRFSYDRNMLELCCQKINDNLLHTPFDEKNFYSKLIDLFESGVNFLNIEYSYLKIEFEKEVDSLNIHSIDVNFLIYNFGICCLAREKIN